MHIKNCMIAATALSALGGAEFIVVTEFPEALQSLSPQQVMSWVSSAAPRLQSQLLDLATDSSYIARATSVLPQLRDFAATATVSLPSEVTAIDKLQVYTTVPEWYSQLPSPVRSLYDDAGKQVESLLQDVAVPTPRNSTASITSTASVTPTASAALSESSSAPAEATGNAGKVQAGMGFSVAAGVFGVLMM